MVGAVGIPNPELAPVMIATCPVKLVPAGASTDFCKERDLTKEPDGTGVRDGEELIAMIWKSYWTQGNIGKWYE